MEAGVLLVGSGDVSGVYIECHNKRSTPYQGALGLKGVHDGVVKVMSATRSALRALSRQTAKRRTLRVDGALSSPRARTTTKAAVLTAIFAC